MYNNYPQYQPNNNMMNGGLAYGNTKPQAINSQPLTADVVNTLRQEGSEINMKIDQRDIWRAICTHKDPTTGQNTLAQNDDGSYTCSICGKTFNFFEGTTAQIEGAVKTLNDMLQTCKTIYLDAPIKMTEQYYQIIPLLEKFPALWSRAVNNFSKYENVPNSLNPISNNYGGFNALNNLLTNPYYMQQQMGYQYPMYNQQPMMPQPAQYPMYNQQPMGYQQPMMQQPAQYPMYNQQPADPNANPLGYGVPAAPTAPMPGTMPAQNVAPVTAPAAPATQNGEIQQQKVYNV